MADKQDPLAQIYRLYVKIEARAAAAAESLVGTNAFGELLATSASNAMALAKLANGGIDRGVRALRVAGRADVADLARQLARTEDKLERMLQVVEELEGRLDVAAAPPAELAGSREIRPAAVASDGATDRVTPPVKAARKAPAEHVAPPVKAARKAPAGRSNGASKSGARTTAAAARRRAP